ncbi:superoxide dismutase family protein [Luteimonas sp. BDR2-5]|uniref:superoxide dismutase family protein n=1 Tax=Proluteimonas luteida TaxID=2878685 RepID=UPI001E4D354F|nr:superoxide dismutase family protein [Luteimonas sp. BDR2-5]MCD9027994.1 superoxide dismutase family protein [Luteimonas sp. BDR2-5]
MTKTRLALLTPALLALAACGANNDAPGGTSPAVEADRAAEVPAPPAAPAATATVTLEPTAGNQTAGQLTFTDVDGRIEVTGTVTGLAPDSEHGFHVHEHGDCSAPDGSSAGGHFNPGGSEHGRVGHGAHHAGDSDNISAGADGTAQVHNWLEGATIGDGAPTDIVGKGVIVHTKSDDYTTQPTGDAGDRLACGVIQ